MKRKQHTRSEIQTWLKRYRRANLGVRAFTRQHGLAVSTFYKWLRDNPGDTESSPPQVVEVTDFTIPESVCCELVWPDGRRLRFPSNLTPEILRGWLAVVEGPS